MVKRSECVSHSAVEECGCGLAISGGGNDPHWDVPRPAPSSPETTHYVREVGPSVIQVRVFEGDHLSGHLVLNLALIVSVLGESLFLGQDEVGRDSLPASAIEVLGKPLRLTIHRIDVREVGFSSILADNPESRSAPPGSGIQPSLKVRNLASTFRGLPDGIEHRVKTLDERHQISVVIGIADTLAILIPVQQGLEMLSGAALGPETP